MGIGKIIQDFSWETLMSLPPSEFLALVVLAAGVIYLVANGVLRIAKG